MELVAPAGPVYQAGTLSGNPLAMTAGIETLKLCRAPGFYEALETKARRLADGLVDAARDVGVAVRGTRVGSMMTAFFVDCEVVDYATAKTADAARYAAFFQAMLEQRVSLAPSQFEAAFVSAAHTEADLERTVRAARVAFQAAARAGG